MGSNMAENHPVGFQWPMEAKRRGAKLIHIDPRFSRTSAMADLHVPIRAGSDIAFLGGVINYILEHERYFEEYVRTYTNAATIINEDFRDTEDLDGMFSGWDVDSSSYSPETWQYEGLQTAAAAGQPGQGSAVGQQAHGAHGGEMEGGEPPFVDHTLQHPRCVFQLLRKHYRRYTPEFVERVCGVPAGVFEQVAEALCANSGRERTSALVYSVGWTQHSVAVQYIRAAAIVQLLLGNIGRPGGGIMALRGHASIQGSTDIPTLYDILPGYLPMPHPRQHPTLEYYVEAMTPDTGFWGHADAYMTSLLKAWWGENATEENEYCFQYLPRITGDHSHYHTVAEMGDGKLEGYFVMGENPVVGSANSRMQRLGLAKLKWLVVRDFVEIETASFWQDSAEIEAGETRPEEIGTEVFLMPAAAHTEKDGTFTNTQRLLQWHHKAIEAPGDARSELWFMYHLGRRVREKLAGSSDPKDRPILELTWDYPTEGPHDDPSADAVLAEINGHGADGKPLSGYTDLKADGSTSCGCWIYCGCYADGVNQTARRKPGSQQSWVAPEWGWAWPMNRRTLYNRASADPDGNPWSERKRYVWWDAEKSRWTGHDVPDFKADMPPDYVPDEGATAEDALRGDTPFILQADGRGWLFAPSGLTDGPMPTHYEPIESPFPNLLYPRHSNPAAQRLWNSENPYHPSHGNRGSEVYPYVAMTYRLTEHHTAGGMSRTLPYLAELQPEFFVEVSPELAAERGLEHAGWATIITARNAIEARVLVTARLRPLQVHGRTVHQVGLPYHWGRLGYSKGDSANEILGIAMDSNVHIGEYKASTCDIQPGRRPRDRQLRKLVESYRARAGIQ
jgi:formate dehydrogenase major subunit